jgi:hypothetical protein
METVMRLFVGLAVASLMVPAVASAQPAVGVDAGSSTGAPTMQKVAKIRAVPARTTRPAVAEVYRLNKQVRAAQLAELSANAEDNSSR